MYLKKKKKNYMSTVNKKLVPKTTLVKTISLFNGATGEL